MLRKHQCYQNIFICFVLVKSMHKKCIIWEELNMFSCLLMTVNVKRHHIFFKFEYYTSTGKGKKKVHSNVTIYDVIKCSINTS